MMILLLPAVFGIAVGMLLGYQLGYRGLKAKLIRSKAELTNDPDELARWRDVINTL